MRAPATRLDPSALFSKRVHWIADREFPWLTATDGGEAIFLRLNTSFPDQPLYSLLVDQDETYDFDDLPAAWSGVSRHGRVAGAPRGPRDAGAGAESQARGGVRFGRSP